MAELNDETIISVLQQKENFDTVLEKSNSSSSSFDALLEKSPLKSDNLRNNLTLDANSSSDEEAVKSFRKRIKRFSDSDSEVEADKENIKGKSIEKTKEICSGSEDEIFRRKKIVSDDSSDENVSSKKDSARLSGNRSKLHNKANISSDSEDDLGQSKLAAKSSDEDVSPKNESARISDKRSRLHDKFKGLLNKRSKGPELLQKSPTKSSADEHNSDSDESSSGIASIKQKIKVKSALLKSGICDPDTSSDEESSHMQQQKKKKTNQKSAIIISPKQMSKPARMSAKQAMENMQKIKSESNRMLREKEVSLPYHRPKALSLKDIMDRRKPALSADGKVLPVKMNSDQLKQYVKLLEQRNKEMMELCKSESEEEDETNETPTSDNKEPDAQPTTDLPSVPIATSENNELCDTEKLTDEIINPQNDENPEINVVPTVDTEESNENELPDLTIEIVQKEPNTENIENPKNVADVEMKDASDQNIIESETTTKLATEIESQLMELRYDTEKMKNTEDMDVQNVEHPKNEMTTNGDNANKSNSEIDKSSVSEIDKATTKNAKANSNDDDFDDDFSDVDINMEDLESIIENANDAATAVDSPMLIRDPYNLNKKPKLTGAPGMVIDLDGSNPAGPRKLTGVELLKERFTYFAKLKTPEEKERERELTIKPGMLHLKLKQELEEKISEQRSLEWAKRLEEEKQQQNEMNAIRGDDSDEDDLEKIEAKLQEKEDIVKESSSETEEDEDEEEESSVVKEKPRKRNPMIDDEAEVSDDEPGDQGDELAYEGDDNVNQPEDADNEDDEEDSDESSDESSEDEKENESKPKKGRILKAFEDSDDESTSINDKPADDVANSEEVDMFKNTPTNASQIVKDSQDDILPLAQIKPSLSEDLFGSQTSCNTNEDTKKISDEDCADMTTQSFSILNTNTSEQNKTENNSNIPTKIDVICETQASDEANLDDVVGMCSGKFTQTQNVIPAESQLIESQLPIGEDILELCTGKFYDNQFVSQADVPTNSELLKEKTTESIPSKKREDKDLLDSILKDMDDPEQDPNRKKYVFDNATENEAVSFEPLNHVRKKFIIDSDDESNLDGSKPVKKKKLKKRKPEKRALQISDDEEEEQVQPDEAEEYMSEVDEEDAVERIVEYDSEENEVEVKPQKQKKGRKMAEFFEQEAELTSEDEWVGSGDEDERGLDRMEREEGDDDTFHQGRLQRELGQIHMRDVLDQDKREVRLIQELLFEDGDLGDGHRQRKFRWRNPDGEEEPGAAPALLVESQEEEFESEELWRKQRHEREVFLRSLKEKDKEGDEHNTSIDRGTIIKANLCSKTMSSLLLEVNGTTASTTVEETTLVVEKKKEEPSRNMPLPVFKQSYHGSLLTRGRGALARLAALAMPLASEADEAKPALGVSNSRNFVFAAVTPPNKEAKVQLEPFLCHT